MAMSLTNSKLQHAGNPPTEKVWQSLAEKKGAQLDSITLSDGSKGLWIGNKTAKKIFVYYHGTFSI